MQLHYVKYTIEELDEVRDIFIEAYATTHRKLLDYLKSL